MSVSKFPNYGQRIPQTRPQSAATSRRTRKTKGGQVPAMPHRAGKGRKSPRGKRDDS